MKLVKEENKDLLNEEMDNSHDKKEEKNEDVVVKNRENENKPSKDTDPNLKKKMMNEEIVKVLKENKNIMKALLKTDTTNNVKIEDDNSSKKQTINKVLKKENKNAYKELVKNKKDNKKGKNVNKILDKKVDLEKDLSEAKLNNEKLLKKIFQLEQKEKNKKKFLKKKIKKIKVQKELLKTEKTNQILLKKLLEIEYMKNNIKSQSSNQKVNKKRINNRNIVNKPRTLNRNSRLEHLSKKNNQMNKTDNNQVIIKKLLRKNSIQFSNQNLKNKEIKNPNSNTIQDKINKKKDKIEDLLITNKDILGSVAKSSSRKRLKMIDINQNDEKMKKIIKKIFKGKPEDSIKNKYLKTNEKEKSIGIEKNKKTLASQKLIKMLNKSKSQKGSTLDRIEKIHRENQKILKIILKFIKSEKINLLTEKNHLKNEKIGREENNDNEQEQNYNASNKSLDKTNSIKINRIKVHSRKNNLIKHDYIPNNRKESKRYEKVIKNIDYPNDSPQQFSNPLIKMNMEHQPINQDKSFQRNIINKNMIIREKGHVNPSHYEVNAFPNSRNSNFRPISNYPNSNYENINNNTISNSYPKECSTSSNQMNKVHNIDDNSQMANEKLLPLSSNGNMRNNISNKDVDRSFIGKNNNNNPMSSINNHLSNSDEDWDYSRNFEEVIPVYDKESDEDIKNELPPVRLGKINLDRENGHKNRLRN